MNTPHQNPNDDALSRILRSERPAPTLPPGFQENVWRRIAGTEAPVRAGSFWLDALMAYVLRPRFALATACALILAGAGLGVREGNQTARQEAQARYMSAVAPGALR